MTAPLQLEFRLNRPQLKARRVYGRRKTLFLGFGRGVGKSWFDRFLVYNTISEWEYRQRPNSLKPLTGARVGALMPTLKQFKDVHWSDFQNELGRGGPWEFLRAKLDSQTGQITFPGGSWIKPFPASDYNSRTSRGLRVDTILADEIDDIDANVYDAVAVPWLSEPWSLGIEIQSGTPTRGRHGLWYRGLKAGELGERLRTGQVEPQEALSSKVGQTILEVFLSLPKEHWPEDLPKDPEQAALHVLRGFYSFHATYRDAPETVSGLAVARAKATTPASTFRREWEADPDAAEGLVYGDVFSEQFHVRMPPPGVVWSEILIGADHGWEDPGCLLLIGVLGSGRDATLWVLDEVYEQHKSDSWWVQQLAQWVGWYPRHRFYPDPSRPGLIEDYRSQAGARPQEVDNSIEDGIAAVADRFVTRQDERGNRFARLYVSPKCEKVIYELGRYRRKRDPLNRDRFLEDVVDRDNHAMDALRYAIVSRFGRVPSQLTGAPDEYLG